MTRVLSRLLLLIFLIPVTYVRGTAPPTNDSQSIALKPISFSSADPGKKRAGRLEFLAGWEMTSDNSSFGGISAMLLTAERRFVMLSDAGVLIRFTLDEEKGLARRPAIAPLPDGPPRQNEFARKNWDAESLLHDPETNRHWVGFERQHGIWRYGPSFARKEHRRNPPQMADWPVNGGAEAMLRLPGRGDQPDRFLVFAETAEQENNSTEALIFTGDPAIGKAPGKLFGYRPPRGYRITDAALLPDGQALILHRRFTPLHGVSAILSIGDPAAIAPGKIWTSRRIALLDEPLAVDNMEALAVTEEDGDTIIWIASDDNYNPLQRSLLLKFRLLRGKPDRSGKAAAAVPENTAGKRQEKAGENPGS